MNFLAAESAASLARLNQTQHSPIRRKSERYLRLIEHGPIINAALKEKKSIHNLVDSFGEPIFPIIYAAATGQPAVMEKCIDGSSLENASTPDFPTPFHALFDIEADEPHAQEVIKKTCDFYRSTLPLSTETIIIEQLSYCNPLINATKQANERLVRKCLENGLQVNKQDGAGRTALMIAVAQQNYPLISLLYEHDASALVVDSMHRSVVDFAESQEAKYLKAFLEIVKARQLTTEHFQYRPASKEEMEEARKHNPVKQNVALEEYRVFREPAPIYMNAGSKIKSSSSKNKKRKPKIKKKMKSKSKKRPESCKYFEPLFEEQSDGPSAPQIIISTLLSPDSLLMQHQESSFKKGKY